ncbi:methyltransferase domain-containing protein [uncultured Helicobacter sp.]|uniref:methyltransferase domain-containing protein n=1 Tax=uncultured Helicobacter sp. TaxID=175537 RepID=UPI003752675E
MSLVAKRFLHHAHTYTQHAIVQHKMALTLTRILQAHRPKLQNIFEFGCGVGNYTSLLAYLYPHAHFVCNDINDYTQYCNKEFLCFDMEHIDEILSPRTFDLITANAAIQWLNQQKCLQTLPKFLRKNGVLLFSSFGVQNFWQIKQLCGVGLQYLSLETYQEILSQNFEILHLSSFQHTLCFESPLEVFRHLHYSGVNSLQKGFFLSKELLCAYEKTFSNALTYDCIFVCAKRKDTILHKHHHIT